MNEVNATVLEIDPLFVPFGFYEKALKIFESNQFYPFVVTGDSGTGKTYMVMQAAAKAERPLLRINITLETDEDDLIGGFRLKNGETVFEKGPVIKAMETGSILLLDEYDLGHPSKIMCLQSILEGNGYFIKKTGEFVKPVPGFTIVATANTRGRGNDDGKYVGTNVLNEAFLERFVATFEGEFPPKDVELNILSKLFDDLGVDPEEGFPEMLVEWANQIRRTYLEGATDDVIATRRLVHIAKTYSIFPDRAESVSMCVSRFDSETAESFFDLYKKVDEKVAREIYLKNNPEEANSFSDAVEEEEEEEEEEDDNLCPF